MSKHKPLDRIDRKIMQLLQRDGRISNVDLAKQVALSPTPCLERVRRLEREGYITGYVALADMAKRICSISCGVRWGSRCMCSRITSIETEPSSPDHSANCPGVASR